MARNSPSALDRANNLLLTFPDYCISPTNVQNQVVDFLPPPTLGLGRETKGLINPAPFTWSAADQGTYAQHPLDWANLNPMVGIKTD